MARPKNQTLRPSLIQAASRIFAEQGFAAAAMTAVGERAGVTKGGVYFHFASKEELFFAVLDHWRGALRAAVQRADRPGRPAAQRLRARLAAWLEFHFTYPVAARVQAVLGSELEGRFSAQLRDDQRAQARLLRQELRGLLSEGLADGSLTVVDPALAGFLLAASLEGIVAERLRGGGVGELFLDAEALADALLAPYRTGLRHDHAALPGESFQPPF